MERQTQKETTLSGLSSYSVVVFALALFVAVLLDILFPYKFITEPWNRYLGVSLIALGTVIVYWAENLGRKFSHKRKRGEITHPDHLLNGPYSITRNPKYLGLAILLVGLGVILNSLYVTLSAIVAVVIVNIFFLNKEEALMSSRHGDIYEEYKKKVKRWL